MERRGNKKGFIFLGCPCVLLWRKRRRRRQIQLSSSSFLFHRNVAGNVTLSLSLSPLLHSLWLYSSLLSPPFLLQWPQERKEEEEGDSTKDSLRFDRVFFSPAAKPACHRMENVVLLGIGVGTGEEPLVGFTKYRVDY